jgi:hypothetical protein
MKQGIILFVVQFILNLVGTVNLISTAQCNYLWTATTDIMIALLGFTAIKKIAEKGNGVQKIVGFTIGAVSGSMMGIWLSKVILN